MADYPYTNIETVVNNTVIRNIGVEHTQEFFAEYHDFFEEQIGNSKAVVMEQTAIKNFFEFDNFFKSIGEITASKSIPVYIADTSFGKGQDESIFWADMLQFTIGGYLAFKPVANTIFQKGTKYAPQDRKANISRRDFLKRTAKILGCGMAGLSLASGTVPGNGLSNLISTKHKLIDDLSYGVCDFRNIMIAEGVDKITRIQEGPIVTIHGDAHPCHIMHYLRNPGWRRIKKALYLPWQLVQDTKVRKWEYKAENWRLTDRF